MDIWRVQVQTDGLSVTGQAPGTPAPPTVAGYALEVNDGGGQGWALLAMLGAYIDGFGNYQYESRYRAVALGSSLDPGAIWDNTPADPFTYSPIEEPAGSGIFFVLSVQDGGASYLGGGTLAIEKDPGADHLSFICPLGSMVTSISRYETVTNRPLQPEALAHGLGVSAPVDAAEVTKWRNLAVLKNGVQAQGVDLSAAHPATFGTLILHNPRGCWFGGPPIYTGAPTNDTPNDTQELTRYRTELDHAAADPFSVKLTVEWLPLINFSSSAIGSAMTWAPEHGTLWRGGCTPADLTDIRVQRSFDRGKHWEEHIASSVGSNNSLSLNWAAASVWLTWYDGSAIQQAFSRDLGATWSMPLTIPFSGTFPRHIIHPNHGIGFYFFIASGTDLQLVRSADGGHTFIDATPISVKAGVGPQQVDAAVAPDDSVVVTYFLSGTWTSTRSTDLGLTWS